MGSAKLVGIEGHRSILRVTRTPGPLRLMTPEGEPAWPVKSEEELGDLHQLAAVFGASLEEVPFCQSPDRQEERDEVVWGLGKQAFAAAELYGHLTSRSVRLVEGTAESTAGLGFASVVVTTTERLTYELLERLSARPPGHNLAGIVVAAGAEALHRQVLLRSAASALMGPLRQARIDVAPTFQLRRGRKRVTRAIGEGAPAGLVREALGAGAGLLNLMTHSDGVDACLGGSTTLCPIEATPDWSSGPAPMCVVRGICHRHSMSLTEATLASFLIRPRDVSARLLVFHTCKGILAADSLVDPHSGLLPRLLDQPRIGAVVTTWEMTLMVQQDLDRVAAPLQQGLPVGEALARFLNVRPVRRRNLRMCLFGDPRLRLPASSRITSRTAPTRRDSGDRAFLEAYLHHQRSSRLPNATRLIQEVARYLAKRRRLRPATDTEGGPTREAILNLFCRFGSTPSSDWNQFARIVASVPSPSPCPQCGALTQTWTMRISGPKGPRRRMVNCPRCGFIHDSPADYPHLELRLQGQVLRLAGPRPRGTWSARVMIDPNLATGELPARRWLDWPAGPDGMPVRYFEIGACLEPWPMNITLYLVDGLALVALTCRVRA
jgi:hypothetical protein